MTTTAPGTVGVPSPLVLSSITVDFGPIYAAFEADLATSPAWNALLPAGTGSAINRWLSSATAFMQGGIARALQECFPDTARTPGGVFRAQRLFSGTHIIRARSGSVTAQVARTDGGVGNLVIPSYQQWLVGGVDYFNRGAINVPAGAGPVTITLNQGTVETLTATSDGTAFQRFVLGTPGQWDASDDDLWMTDSFGVQWTAIQTGLWQLSNSATSFREATMPDGTIECRFGDGNYGQVPPIGTMMFGWVSLLSALQTDTTPLVGSTVTPVSPSYTVTGQTTSAAAPNQDHPSPEFYKAMGPGGASNNGTAVTRDGYRAIALQYDGVVDAVFRGQAEINPADIRFMNVLAATLITTTPWSSSQWLAFKKYMESEVGLATAYLIRQDPVAIPVDVEITIYAQPIADLNSLQSLATSVIRNYFSPRAGSLGGSLYSSDLILALAEQSTYQQAPNEAGELIDYAVLSQPTQPVVCSPTSYLTLGNLQVTVLQTQRGLSAAATGQIVGL